jgi:hypothetical protein
LHFLLLQSTHFCGQLWAGNSFGVPRVTIQKTHWHLLQLSPAANVQQRRRQPKYNQSQRHFSPGKWTLLLLGLTDDDSIFHWLLLDESPSHFCPEAI